MHLRRPNYSDLSMMLACVAVICFAAHFGLGAAVVKNHQIDGVAEAAIARIDDLVESGEQSLQLLAKRDGLNCESAALQTLRLHVYQKSGIKDIRIANHDGTVVCAAFSETLEFDTSRETIAD